MTVEDTLARIARVSEKLNQASDTVNAFIASVENDLANCNIGQVVWLDPWANGADGKWRICPSDYVEAGQPPLCDSGDLDKIFIAATHRVEELAARGRRHSGDASGGSVGSRREPAAPRQQGPQERSFYQRYWMIGFGRDGGGGWRLLAKEIAHGLTSHGVLTRPKALLDCPRDVRIGALVCIPALTEAVLARAEDLVAQIDDAMSSPESEEGE